MGAPFGGSQLIGVGVVVVVSLENGLFVDRFGAALGPLCALRFVFYLAQAQVGHCLV